MASKRTASEFHPEPSRGRRRRDGGARVSVAAAQGGRRRHGGKRGQWGAARKGGEGLWAFTSAYAWHTRGQSEFGQLPLSGSTLYAPQIRRRISTVRRIPPRRAGRLFQETSTGALPHGQTGLARRAAGRNGQGHRRAARNGRDSIHR